MLIRNRDNPMKKRNRDKSTLGWCGTPMNNILRRLGNFTISVQAMNVVKSLVVDVISKILFNAKSLVERTKRKLLKSRDIHFATRLTFSGTLDMHKTLLEAINPFLYNHRKFQDIKQTTPQISPTKIKEIIKSSGMFSRMEKTVSVTLAVLIETLVIELFKHSINVSKVLKKNRIIPRHIKLAIHNDNDLYVIFGKVIIPNSGVAVTLNLLESERPATDDTAKPMCAVDAGYDDFGPNQTMSIPSYNKAPGFGNSNTPVSRVFETKPTSIPPLNSTSVEFPFPAPTPVFGGGFTFATPTLPSSATGFVPTWNSPSSPTSVNGGFSFSTSTSPAGGFGFGFGNTTTPAHGGFNFGSPTSPTDNLFGFGNTTPANSPIDVGKKFVSKKRITNPGSTPFTFGVTNKPTLNEVGQNAILKGTLVKEENNNQVLPTFGSLSLNKSSFEYNF